MKCVSVCQPNPWGEGSSGCEATETLTLPDDSFDNQTNFAIRRPETTFGIIGILAATAAAGGVVLALKTQQKKKLPQPKPDPLTSASLDDDFTDL